MNLFKKNRLYLEQLFPRLGPEIFEKYRPSDELHIAQNSNNVVSGQLDGRWIHSKLNPYREAERLIDKTANLTSASAIFLGFGLGYQIEEFFRRFPQGEAIIIEKSPDLFLKALTARDFTGVLTERASLLIGLEVSELQAALSSLVLRNHSVIPLHPVTQSAPDYYEGVTKLIASERSRKNVNSTTVKRFGKRWIRNLASNLETMIRAGNLNKLAHTFDEIPALIVAAGPSLDEVLPYIKKLQKRMVIIATDTSLRALKRFGIDADFLVVVDPQYWNSRHLDGIDARTTILVSESATHPMVFRFPYRAVFFSGSVFPLGGYLDPGQEKPHKLGAGGSVATTAWDFAHYIGSREVYITGMDLGFPEKKTHYRGSFFEDRLLSLTGRFSPYEGHIFDYLHNGEPFYHDNFNGGYTLTDRRLIIYRQWFEEQLNSVQRKTFTLSPEGIKIEGIGLKRVENLLDLPVIRKDINDRLDSIIATYTSAREKNYQHRRARLLQKIQTLIDELHAIKATADKGLHTIESVENCMDGEYRNPVLQQALHTLDDIDKQLLQSAGRYVAGFLINPVLEQIQDELFSQQSLKESFKASQTIYRHLSRSAQFHIDLFSGSSVDNINKGLGVAKNYDF